MQNKIRDCTLHGVSLYMSIYDNYVDLTIIITIIMCHFHMQKIMNSYDFILFCKNFNCCFFFFFFLEILTILWVDRLLGNGCFYWDTIIRALSPWLAIYLPMRWGLVTSCWHNHWMLPNSFSYWVQLTVRFSGTSQLFCTLELF